MNERDFFIEALQRPDPAERAAYIEQACTDDAALRRRVEVLLEAHIEASGFLKGPAHPDPATAKPDSSPTMIATGFAPGPDPADTHPITGGPGNFATDGTDFVLAPKPRD